MFQEEPGILLFVFLPILGGRLVLKYSSVGDRANGIPFIVTRMDEH
jgi:hypothetical protein